MWRRGNTASRKQDESHELTSFATVNQRVYTSVLQLYCRASFDGENRADSGYFGCLTHLTVSSSIGSSKLPIGRGVGVLTAVDVDAIVYLDYCACFVFLALNCEQAWLLDEDRKARVLFRCGRVRHAGS